MCSRSGLSLDLEIDADETLDEGKGIAHGECSARISNGAAENGYPTAGPLSWLNSARVTADPEEDSVHLSVSVADPRGGFGFTVRRLNPDGERKGQIVIHVPYPGQDFAHCPVKWDHEGTLLVVSDHNLPRMPDSVALLSDILKIPGVKDSIRGENARERREKVPTYRRILSRVREWQKARAAHDHATPATFEDEEPEGNPGARCDECGDIIGKCGACGRLVCDLGRENVCPECGEDPNPDAGEEE